MVSMKDIAAKCNVSVATVSKALNDQSDIGEETRKLIKKTAREMGYFPNSLARALRTNKSYNIGVLFVDEGRSGLTHDYFSRVLDSFKEVVEDNGYDITFINCSKKRPQRMSYLEHSRYRGFDGIVIACIDFTDPEVIELSNADIPMVTIDYMFNNRSSVVSNNYAGMSTLMEYIISKGHKKIAYVCGEDTAVTRNRLAAYYKALEDHGIDVPADYVVHSSYRSTSKSEAITDKFLERKDRPTCILYPDDYSAMGGLNSIHKHGLNVPDDISIAGFDGINIAHKIEPKIATIRQDTKAIGEMAALKLLSLMERPKSTVEEQLMVDGTLEEGKSIAQI